MIKEKIVYEVNGKTFDNKVDALNEEMENESNKNKEVAEKILEIFNTLKGYSKISKNNKLFESYIDITDEDLKPKWFVDRKYSEVFVSFLKAYNIRYNYSDGDERKEAYLKIAIGSDEIENIPDLNEIVKFIEKTLIEITKEKEDLESMEDYLKSIR